MSRLGTIEARLRLAERFSRKFKATDACWFWRGGVTSRGYGSIRHKGRNHAAHRVAWELMHGAIPAGLLVCHRCDNPLCVRPEHLFLGTPRDNMQDKVRKGRAHGAPAGEKHWFAKLGPEDVHAIRAAFAAGDRQHALASTYRVHQSTISDIVRRKSWAHLRSQHVEPV